MSANPPAAELVNQPVSWCRAQWRARIALTPLEGGETFQTVDRIEKEQVPNLRQHRGIYVDLIQGQNTGRMRDRVTAEMLEQVRVVILWHVNPKDQQASQAAAENAGDALTQWVTDDRAWHGEWNVKIVSQRRDRHPASTEWYVVEHTYTMRRYARVGG